MTKSLHPELNTTRSADILGRPYCLFCLEQALANLQRARVLVAEDVIEESHELAQIEALLASAIAAS